MIKIEINNYLRRVQVSNARRPKYWAPKDELPEKLLDTTRYIWKKRSGFINLYDNQEKEFVIKNPKAAGTPGYQSIAGNEIYARMHERKRMMIVDALKNHFKEHISAKVNSIPEDMFPLSISMEIHSSYGVADWDLDNLWIYHKCFQDSLKDLELIPDDNVLYITEAGKTSFIAVSEDVTPKLVFVIRKSEESYPKTYAPIYLRESSEGTPGEIKVTPGNVTLYTGKRKVIYGAAKDAVRKTMLYALNNFKTVFVPHEMYSRYKQFFDENRFGGKVTIVLIP